MNTNSGLIIPGVVTIADIVLDKIFTTDYFAGKWDYLANQTDSEKRKSWNNLFGTHIYNSIPLTVSLANEKGFEEYLVTQPHVRNYCKLIAKEIKGGASLNSAQIYEHVRGLAHMQHILYHRHCENSRLGLNMTLNEAELDYTGRGYNVGFRQRLNEKSIPIEKILCARTLEACCSEVDAYDAIPESLDSGQPLVEGSIAKFPTGTYMLIGGRYVPSSSTSNLPASAIRSA